MTWMNQIQTISFRILWLHGHQISRIWYGCVFVNEEPATLGYGLGSLCCREWRWRPPSPEAIRFLFLLRQTRPAFWCLLFNYLETSSASCFQGYIIPTQTHTHTLAAVWFDVRKDFLVVDDFSLARWRWSWNQGSSALLPLPHQLNATCVHWDPTSGHPYPSEKIPRPRLSAAAVSIRMEND